MFVAGWVLFLDFVWVVLAPHAPLALPKRKLSHQPPSRACVQKSFRYDIGPHFAPKTGKAPG